MTEPQTSVAKTFKTHRRPTDCDALKRRELEAHGAGGARYHVVRGRLGTSHQIYISSVTALSDGHKDKAQGSVHVVEIE